MYAEAKKLDSLSPRLEDIGVSLKRVTQANPKQPDEPVFDYWSLSSEKLVFSSPIRSSIAGALPEAKEVITYLANDIRKSGEESGVPFSMISAIDFDQDFQLTSVDDEAIPALADDQIVLNEWAAEDLSVKPGDSVEVEYFLPETTHGNQVTETAKFEVVAIAKLTRPEEPFQVRRRNQIVDAVFDTPPTLANDPDLTPTVPGVTDSDSIENWELPFATAGKLRAQDDDYWNNYRTTPKAFISLASGKRLFASRFGSTTSFRVPVDAGNAEAIEQKLLAKFESDKTDLGLRTIPIRKKSLTAASGSTPFDALFLALSMFVILSALILVSLLFRLAIQGRIAEVGLLQAVGINSKQVAGIWLREMIVVCLIGSLLGVMIGIGYGAILIHGLKTWWVGAISTPFLNLSISPLSLLIGLFSGTLICWATIWWTLRQTRKQSVRQLLSGQIESGDDVKSVRRPSRIGLIVSVLLMVGAIVLLVVAFGLSGDAKSGAFMGAGFLVLAAGLLIVYRRLKTPQPIEGSDLDLKKMALMAARRNPLRSVLTISLVSVASFLIIAVSSFRLSPTESGTGGFDFVATSSRPVFADLNTEEGQQELLGDQRLDPEVKTIAMRLKPGQDASCNNLFQATQPQVIGVPDDLADYFDDPNRGFEWAGTESGETANPWRLLADGQQRSAEDPIPVILDKNTANYSLKIFALGTIYEVNFDSGESVKFEVVGFLNNTILQGSLLIGEADFKRTFPSVAGYRYFLIDTGDAKDPEQQIATMESALGDQGFDARGSIGMLKEFHGGAEYLSEHISVAWRFGVVVGNVRFGGSADSIGDRTDARVGIVASGRIRFGSYCESDLSGDWLVDGDRVRDWDRRGIVCDAPALPFRKRQRSVGRVDFDFCGNRFDGRSHQLLGIAIRFQSPDLIVIARLKAAVVARRMCSFFVRTWMSPFISRRAIAPGCARGTGSYRSAAVKVACRTSRVVCSSERRRLRSPSWQAFPQNYKRQQKPALASRWSVQLYSSHAQQAGLAELADALDSKSNSRKGVEVQVL